MDKPHPAPLRFTEFVWPEVLLPPAPDSVEEMAQTLGLERLEEPSQTILGLHYRRQVRDKHVDFLLSRAAEAATWAVGSFRPPNPLANLVSAVLAQAGLFYAEHPKRNTGIRQRERLVRALYDLSRRLGLATVKQRAARVARAMDREETSLPVDPYKLVALLRTEHDRIKYEPLELGLTSSGRRRLQIGGQPIEIQKGSKMQGLGPDSMEGKALIAAALGGGPVSIPAAGRSRLKAALAAHGVELKVEGETWSLEPRLTVAAELKPSRRK